MSQLLFSTSVIIFMMGLVSEQICQLRFERRTAIRKSDYMRRAENIGNGGTQGQQRDEAEHEQLAVRERRVSSR